MTEDIRTYERERRARPSLSLHAAMPLLTYSMTHQAAVRCSPSHGLISAEGWASVSTSPSRTIQATPTSVSRRKTQRRPGVQVRTCTVFQEPNVLFSFNRVQSFLYWTLTSASFPIRCPIQHRILFVVLCIHICAVLEKDPSKFHMSMELARVLLERGADMEAQDDDGKRICRPRLDPSQTRRTYRSTGQI
jgi:hypothetical protein